MSNGGGPIAGLGQVPLWGHSPAIDFMQYITRDQQRNTAAIRILVVGQADARHVLETFSKNREFLENNNVVLEFYLAEDFPEVIGRQMLLLLLAMQPLTQVGLQEKCLQWLEIFGNSLIRPKTRRTLIDMTDKLIELVSTPTEGSVFDLSHLKFRERDDLFEIFNHWKSFSGTFPIQDSWKKRVEKHLGVRYDARQNVFDWDYNMHLADNRPCVIAAAEYKKWRQTGIAFADFDADYSQPNVSLATGIASGGGAFLSYRGEIVTGPFISFGIQADDSDLFKTENGKYKCSAYDISIHNLQQYFSAIAASTCKVLAKHLRVTLLSPATFGTPRFFAKFQQGFFDAGFFSTASAQYLIPPITNLFKSGAPVLIEDTRYLLELRPDQRNLYRQKIAELAKESKLEPVTTVGETSVFIQYIKGTSAPANEKAGIPAPANQKAAISRPANQNAGTPSTAQNGFDACADDASASSRTTAALNSQDAKNENIVPGA